MSKKRPLFLLDSGILLAHLAGATEDCVGFYDKRLRYHISLNIGRCAQSKRLQSFHFALYTPLHFGIRTLDIAVNEPLLANYHFAAALDIAFHRAIYADVVVGYYRTDDLTLGCNGVIECALLILLILK